MTTKLHNKNKHSQINASQALNKQQIKDTLYAGLYDPVVKQFKTRLQGLAALNSFVARHSNSSFTYRGKLYNHDSDRPPLVEPRELMSSLHPLMNCYLQDLDEINRRELPHVLDYIHSLLIQSNNLQCHPTTSADPKHEPNKLLSSSDLSKRHSTPLENLYDIVNTDFKALGLIKQRRATNLLIASAASVTSFQLIPSRRYDHELRTYGTQSFLSSAIT